MYAYFGAICTWPFKLVEGIHGHFQEVMIDMYLCRTELEDPQRSASRILLGLQGQRLGHTRGFLPFGAASL